MKNHLTKTRLIVSLAVITSIFSLQSCIKRGCTDPDATNYDKSVGGYEPGSCIYSQQYQLYGNYVANDYYNTSYCGSSSDYYSVEVTQGNTSTSLYISGLANGMSAIKFERNGYDLAAASATGLWSPWGTVNLIFATGTINGSEINVSYRISDFNYNANCGYIDGNATLYK